MAVVILPSGFGLPPLLYLLALVVALAATLGALYVRRPQVSAATVAAFSPWMAAGGALYALYQADVVPAVVAPLFSSPAVYVTVFVVAGLLWAAVGDRPSESWEPTGAPALLAGAGTVVLLATLVFAAVRSTPGAVGTTPQGSGAILLVSLIVAAVAWGVVTRFADVAATGAIGVIVVFGHTLDGISTAVGYDRLEFGEQTPLSRILLEAGETLPAPELLGAGWLFVLVKVALGTAIVVLFEEYVRDEPTQGYLLLGLIAGVGLGPGFHNLVLFAIL
jgi:uncharacterized membrane protein